VKTAIVGFDYRNNEPRHADTCRSWRKWEKIDSPLKLTEVCNTLTSGFHPSETHYRFLNSRQVK
jgi:hypothetical protein